MLKSLKRKFVLMTMSMITVVLLIVFAAQIIGTYRQQLNTVRLSLQQAVGADFGVNTGRVQFGRNDGDGDILLNTVSLLVDESGSALYTGTDSVSISDDDLTSAISSVLSSDADEGRIRPLGLFFMREKQTCLEFKLNHLIHAMPDGLHEDGGTRDQPWGERPPEDGEASELDELALGGDKFGRKELKLVDDDFLTRLEGIATALQSYDDSAVLYKIALVSDNSMHSSMRGLLLTSLLVGLVALVILFVICLYLANWAFRPVEATWNQQKRFISDASHELKTPLTVILANLDIMGKHGGETVAEQRRWIDNSTDEALRMKNLVEDLLTLARLDEAGQTAPEIEQKPVDLSDLVMGVALTFEPIAFERGLTLESDVAPNVNVLGDEKRLHQLVSILIDNACKYAGANGRIDVKLSVNKDKARLDVINTGDVIPRENLEHLFDRFYRADAARSGEKAGYGLGLSIAAGIVRHHKGDITAHSDAVEGTRFTVTLPKI